jgi:hypothetical protein
MMQDREEKDWGASKFRRGLWTRRRSGRDGGEWPVNAGTAEGFLGWSGWLEPLDARREQASRSHTQNYTVFPSLQSRQGGEAGSPSHCSKECKLKHWRGDVANQVIIPLFLDCDFCCKVYRVPRTAKGTNKLHLRRKLTTSGPLHLPYMLLLSPETLCTNETF